MNNINLIFFLTHTTNNKPEKKLTFCQQKINKDVNQRQSLRIILFNFIKNIFYYEIKYRE